MKKRCKSLVLLAAWSGVLVNSICASDFFIECTNSANGRITYFVLVAIKYQCLLHQFHLKRTWCRFMNGYWLTFSSYRKMQLIVRLVFTLSLKDKPRTFEFIGHINAVAITLVDT